MTQETRYTQTHVECNSCHYEFEWVDKEWIEPNQWEHTYECPCCHHLWTEFINGFVSHPIDCGSLVENIKTEYIEGRMSIDAFERSVDRALKNHADSDAMSYLPD